MQNEPAFPNVCDEANGMNCFPGMSLRDYFAAKAMENRKWNIYTGVKETMESLTHDACMCYAIAAAMMKAREQWHS